MQTHFCKCGCGQPCLKTFKRGHYRRGMKNSPEARLKISQNMKARIASGTWKNPMLSEESRKKAAERSKAAKKGKHYPPTMKGKHLSEEAKAKIRKAKLGKTSPRKGMNFTEQYGLERGEEIRKKIGLKMQARSINGVWKSPSTLPEVKQKLSEKLREARKKKYWGPRHKGKTLKETYGPEKVARWMETVRTQNRESLKKAWQDDDYRKITIEKMLGASWKRPTRFEAKIVNIIDRHQLPFKYVGNGKLIVCGKNPDFISTDGTKLIIETYCFFWHNDPQKYPNGYEQDRANLFSTEGYKTLFLNDNDLKSQDWEKICLSKIQNFITAHQPFQIPITTPIMAQSIKTEAEDTSINC